MIGGVVHDEGMGMRALCLVVDGFEEIETITPVDLLRRAGADVTTAAMGETRQVCGRCGVMIEADALFDEIDPEGYDLLLLTGGPGVRVLRADGRPAELAAAFLSRDKWVAAICAAPLVLKDAGMLDGRSYTAHFSTVGELPDALADEAVVVDGRLVTSRGAGTALAFGLELIGLIYGQERADEIGATIMV